MLSVNSLKLYPLICLMLFLIPKSLCVERSIDGKVHCKEKERRALLKFKHALVDDYGRLSSWDNEDCCQWNGVKCNNRTGHVEMLDLHGDDLFQQPLRGEISTSLMDLPFLNYLNLSANNFNGTQIPEFFGSLSKLRYLDLWCSSFGGKIPHQLGKLSSLQYLDLSSNNIVGVIPSQLGNLSNLQTLRLGRNYCLKFGEENSVDAKWISNLSSLTELGLRNINLHNSNNWLKTIGALPYLTKLWLSNCNLSDVDFRLFSSQLNSSASLTLLDMGNNNFTLSMFLWLFNFSSNLLDLYLHDNHLRGPIPYDFGNKLPHLEVLYMPGNQFSAQIPDCWSNLNSLVVLDLSNNNLSGNIPITMGSLVEIRQLILRNNILTGELPSLKNCTKLLLLDVGENELTGPIPSWLGESIHSLEMLILRKNHFYGYLPSYLCHLTNIQVLDLSSNNLLGQIPQCLNNFSAMSKKIEFNESAITWYIDYSYRFFRLLCAFNPFLTWKGKELEFKDGKRFLKTIDLSSNHLSGKIPVEFGDLVELVSLNLSRNNLSEQIPQELGKLHSLDSLDLSRNHLFGQIPSNLSQISMLGVLDLSNNNLSGQIPIGTQLQSFNASVYSGNPELCGSPLVRLCLHKMSEGRHEDAVHQEEEYSLFNKGFYVSAGIGFFIGFWGIFGSLLLIRSWRHAYFNFLNNFNDWIYVTAIVTTLKFRRRLHI